MQPDFCARRKSGASLSNGRLTAAFADGVIHASETAQNVSNELWPSLRDRANWLQVHLTKSGFLLAS